MTTLTAEDRKALKGVIQEVSNSMTRTEAEKEFIRDAIKDASDKYQIPKRTLQKIARAYHKSNIDDERSSLEEFLDLYDSICNK